jgi:hypothetical protein
MRHRFIARPLDPRSADQGFALARNAVLGLSLAEWRYFLEESARGHSGNGGVLAVQNRLGIMQGLCRYSFEPTLGRGRICTVEILVALDLVDEVPVALALMQALEDLARRKDATALRLRLAQAAPATDRLVTLLLEKGHCVDSVGLIKNLDPAESACW